MEGIIEKVKRENGVRKRRKRERRKRGEEGERREKEV